jgi:hypothetical protein
MSRIVLGVYEYGKSHTTLGSGDGQPPMTALVNNARGNHTWVPDAKPGSRPKVT